MDPFQIGDVFAGKYEITRVLGQGGMGVVVAARHRELGDLVALKFLRPSSSESAESQARFAREARTANRIKNEHVARVFDAGVADGVPFMVMEHLTGEDLARMLRRRGPLPAAEAVDLLLQACEAVADAHNLGVVHRDLKPANLFVTTSADGLPFVKVLDFGISRSTAPGDPSLTATAAVVGTPLYTSPEQLASGRTVDVRTDVWSLGVILYEMLTGGTPFAGESFATLSAAILRGTFAPVTERRPDCPAALAEAVAGALERDRSARLPTVAAFAARIAPCGSEAARVSCERIERIAARVAPPSQPGEGDAAGTTLEQGPPSAVAGAGGAAGGLTGEPATGDVSRVTALGRSVAPPAGKRPLGRLARLALGAGAAGVVVAATVVGVQRASSRPPAELGQGGARSVVGAPAADDASQGEVSAATASDAAATGGGWHATRITDDGRYLGDFAVAAEPSQEHPAGVIAALAFGASVGDETVVDVAAIDVESGRAFTHNLVGYLTDEGTVRIARTHRGVVVGHQRKGGLQLHWYTDGAIDADTRTVPQLGARKDQDLRAFSVFDDRIVVAAGGMGATTVAILDEKGKLLSSHVCHGGLFSPGDAALVQVGDDVLVTNLLRSASEHTPICSGGLHGSPRWRDVALRDGQLEVHAGRVYFSRSGGADVAWVRALDENLQPTGLPPPPEKAPSMRRSCEGVTGTILQRYAEIAGLYVESRESCCGDEGGGLFICRPREGG